MRLGFVAAAQLTVTLITFGQGSDVVERFGHNALWFEEPSRMESVAYHWGLYDFRDPNFLFRFLTGENRYSMGPESPQGLIERERNRGRSVTLQKLNLTEAQAAALREFVRANDTDERRFYRYDYYADNCSTRLRDALDVAFGGSLRRAVASAPVTTFTYRRESVRLTDGAVQAGIDVALGRPADVPLTVWQSFFIPMRLRDALRTMRVPGADGASIPVVAEEHLVPPIVRAPVIEPLQSPRLVLRFLLAGIALAFLVVTLRIMMVSRRSAAWGLAVFGMGWSLVCGLLGVILLIAWFATLHRFWASNLTVLLLSPLSLALVILVPVSVLRRRWIRAARMIAAIIAVLGLVALVLALIPMQEHRAVIALFLPVHLALAWALALDQGKIDLLRFSRWPIRA